MRLSNFRVLDGGFCRQCEYFTGRRSLRIRRFHALFLQCEHPEHGLTLIDSGYGRHYAEATCAFPERFLRWAIPVALNSGLDEELLADRYGLQADDVQTIFISHFHGDHIGGLRHFKNARFVHRADAYRMLRDAPTKLQLKHGFLQKLLPDDFQQRSDGVDDAVFIPGEGLLDGFLVHDYWGDGSLIMVDLPGHALGHTGFMLQTDEGPVFYLADATWDVHVLHAGGRPPWIVRRLTISGADYEHSIEKLRHFAQTHNIRAVATHCPEAFAQLARDSG